MKRVELLERLEERTLRDLSQNSEKVALSGVLRRVS
jgi:hypothetical protein